MITAEVVDLTAKWLKASAGGEVNTQREGFCCGDKSWHADILWGRGCFYPKCLPVRRELVFSAWQRIKHLLLAVSVIWYLTEVSLGDKCLKRRRHVSASRCSWQPVPLLPTKRTATRRHLQRISRFILDIWHTQTNVTIISQCSFQLRVQVSDPCVRYWETCAKCVCVAVTTANVTAVRLLHLFKL